MRRLQNSIATTASAATIAGFHTQQPLFARRAPPNSTATNAQHGKKKNVVGIDATEASPPVAVASTTAKAKIVTPRKSAKADKAQLTASKSNKVIIRRGSPSTLPDAALLEAALSDLSATPKSTKRGRDTTRKKAAAVDATTDKGSLANTTAEADLAKLLEMLIRKESLGVPLAEAPTTEKATAVDKPTSTSSKKTKKSKAAKDDDDEFNDDDFWDDIDDSAAKGSITGIADKLYLDAMMREMTAAEEKKKAEGGISSKRRLTKKQRHQQSFEEAMALATAEMNIKVDELIGAMDAHVAAMMGEGAPLANEGAVVVGEEEAMGTKKASGKRYGAGKKMKSHAATDEKEAVTSNNSEKAVTPTAAKKQPDDPLAVAIAYLRRYLDTGAPNHLLIDDSPYSPAVLPEYPVQMDELASASDWLLSPMSASHPRTVQQYNADRRYTINTTPLCPAAQRGERSLTPEEVSRILIEPLQSDAPTTFMVRRSMVIKDGADGAIRVNSSGSGNSDGSNASSGSGQPSAASSSNDNPLTAGLPPTDILQSTLSVYEHRLNATSDEARAAAIARQMGGNGDSSNSDTDAFTGRLALTTNPSSASSTGSVGGKEAGGGNNAYVGIDNNKGGGGESSLLRVKSCPLYSFYVSTQPLLLPLTEAMVRQRYGGGGEEASTSATDSSAASPADVAATGATAASSSAAAAYYSADTERRIRELFTHSGDSMDELDDFFNAKKQQQQQMAGAISPHSSSSTTMPTMGDEGIRITKMGAVSIDGLSGYGPPEGFMSSLAEGLQGVLAGDLAADDGTITGIVDGKRVTTPSPTAAAAVGGEGDAGAADGSGGVVDTASMDLSKLDLPPDVDPNSVATIAAAASILNPLLMTTVGDNGAINNFMLEATIDGEEVVEEEGEGDEDYDGNDDDDDAREEALNRADRRQLASTDGGIIVGSNDPRERMRQLLLRKAMGGESTAGGGGGIFGAEGDYAALLTDEDAALHGSGDYNYNINGEDDADADGYVEPPNSIDVASMLESDEVLHAVSVACVLHDDATTFFGGVDERALFRCVFAGSTHRAPAAKFTGDGKEGGLKVDKEVVLSLGGGKKDTAAATTADGATTAPNPHFLGPNPTAADIQRYLDNNAADNNNNKKD